MTHRDVARRLVELDARETPSVVRFDEEATFGRGVAVLPAAFNPPTVAHLALVEAGRAVSGAAAAMLSTRNVAKDVHGATLAQRVEMLLALGTDVAVLAVNAARLVDQGYALRSAFPGATFDFVVGYDTLVRLFDPRYYESMHEELAGFFAAHRVLAANRGEATPEVVGRFIDSAEARPFAGRLLAIEVHESHGAVSSTAIRDAAAQERDHEAVPAAVAGYIARHRLYR